MTASPSMIDAVGAVWRIPRPGSDNLLASPTFIALSKLCQAEYGVGKPGFALSTALRSLGLPCHLPANKADLSLDPESAANAIDEAYRRKTTLQRLWRHPPRPRDRGVQHGRHAATRRPLLGVRCAERSVSRCCRTSATAFVAVNACRPQRS